MEDIYGDLENYNEVNALEEVCDLAPKHFVVHIYRKKINKRKLFYV